MKSVDVNQVLDTSDETTERLAESRDRAGVYDLRKIDEAWRSDKRRHVSYHECLEILRGYGIHPTGAFIHNIPSRRSDWYYTEDGNSGYILSYDFVVGDRNVATYMPDLMTLLIQPGHDGHGRCIKGSTLETMQWKSISTPTENSIS